MLTGALLKTIYTVNVAQPNLYKNGNKKYFYILNSYDYED